MERFFSLFGIVLVLGICSALSTNRKAIRVRTVVWGLALQFVLALFVLKTPWGQRAFAWVGAKITRLLELSYIGSEFVFGKLGAKGGADTNIGFIFATQILPAILFVAALFAVLYHLGIMQLIVKAVA
jgi:CNT family concentrative nucleoside transporter